VEPFFKKNDTQNDVEHGIDKVAQAAFDNVLLLNGPNENEPIDADQAGCKATQSQSFFVPKDCTNILPLTNDADTDDQRQQGPGNPVTNDFE
jgi:hypothetical protein